MLPSGVLGGHGNREVHVRGGGLRGGGWLGEVEEGFGGEVLGNLEEFIGEG